MYFLFAGDNILTAVSVARECSIIGRRQRVIQVQASPPAANRPAQIEWVSHEVPHVESETTDHEFHDVSMSSMSRGQCYGTSISDVLAISIG